MREEHAVKSNVELMAIGLNGVQKFAAIVVKHVVMEHVHKRENATIQDHKMEAKIVKEMTGNPSVVIDKIVRQSLTRFQQLMAAGANGHELPNVVLLAE